MSEVKNVDSRRGFISLASVRAYISRWFSSDKRTNNLDNESSSPLFLKSFSRRVLFKGTSGVIAATESSNILFGHVPSIETFGSALSSLSQYVSQEFAFRINPIFRKIIELFVEGKDSGPYDVIDVVKDSFAKDPEATVEAIDILTDLITVDTSKFETPVATQRKITAIKILYDSIQCPDFPVDIRAQIILRPNVEKFLREHEAKIGKQRDVKSNGQKSKYDIEQSSLIKAALKRDAFMMINYFQRHLDSIEIDEDNAEATAIIRDEISKREEWAKEIKLI